MRGSRIWHKAKISPVTFYRRAPRGNSPMHAMRRICVFCGSRSGGRPEFAAAARNLGALLAGHNLGLVYGGGKVGLMGVLADAVMAAGGEVIGVIPGSLADKEVAHGGISELRVVSTMHERKALMAELSDAFIALPGGFGTLDETFEILTWAQLGLHTKPCGMLNAGGYFDSLLVFLDSAVQEGFLQPAHRRLLVQAENPETLLRKLAHIFGRQTPAQGAEGLSEPQRRI